MKIKIPWWRRVLDFALGGIRNGFGLFSRNGNAKPQTEAGDSVEEGRPAPLKAALAESEVVAPDEVQLIEVKKEKIAEPKTVEPAPAEIDIAESHAKSEAIEAEPVKIEVAKAEVSESQVADAEVAAIEQNEDEIVEPVEAGPEISTVAEQSETRRSVEASIEIAEAEAIQSEVPESKLSDCEITEDEAAEIARAHIELENPNEEDEPLKPPSPQSEALAQTTEAAEESGFTPEAAPSNQPAAEELAITKQSVVPAQEALVVEQPSPSPAQETAPAPAAKTEKSPEPVQQSLPLPDLTPGQKTAERVAAMLKARGQDAEDSPFSVIVSQVYDGPLDLLLDLIRKQDIDIYDIPIAKITAQFLAYVDRLRASDMDVAGEFIYTAALLIHIKSKMLLPRAPAGPDDAAEDPRRELVERLLEHERFKNAAQMLHEKQMLEAASWTNPGVREFREDEGAEPEIAADTTDLVRIFRDILERARNRPMLNLQEDTVTVGQMIQFLARRLTMEDKPIALRRLLSHTKSERALIAMFLALLEMVRLQAILLRQDRQFSEIFIKKHTGFEAAMNQGLADARDDWR
jgi:segregation and condensation protein A